MSLTPTEKFQRYVFQGKTQDQPKAFELLQQVKKGLHNFYDFLATPTLL